MKLKKRIKNIEGLIEKHIQIKLDELDKRLYDIENSFAKGGVVRGGFDLRTGEDLPSEYPPDPERWVECIEDGVMGLYKGGRYEIIHSGEDCYKLKGFVAEYAKRYFKPIPKT